MPQYYDRMTPQEVRSVVKEIEATIRQKRKAKSWNPNDWIVFAPQQVINVLKAEEGVRKGNALRVKILDDYFRIRVGAMPNVLKRYGDIFPN